MKFLMKLLNFTMKKVNSGGGILQVIFLITPVQFTAKLKKLIRINNKRNKNKKEITITNPYNRKLIIRNHQNNKL